MMLLKYIGKNVTPPDKFQFTCPHCGYKPNGQFALQDLQSLVRQHYIDNDHPIPDDLRAFVEDQVCQLLPPGWAMYGDGTEPDWHVNTRISGEIVVNGTKVLLELARQALAFKWFGGKSPLVSKELASSRALTCSRCHFNATIEGCASCHGVANMVAEIAGSMTTPSDATLRSCILCGCSGLAQTRVSADILNIGTTTTTLDHYPAFCWRKKEIQALTEAASSSTTSD